LNGRLIAAGDALPLVSSRAPAEPDRQVAPPDRTPRPVHVVLGPQQDYFTPETIDAFLAESWRVTHRADRMGTWLDGPKVAHAHGFNVLSDGLVPGCIQVPGSGQPVVLLMDCQTIGGYPKLATIVTADLARFTQTRPGNPVAFAAVGLDAAHRLYRDHHTMLAAALNSVSEVIKLTARSLRSHW
jgi:allophanate hydrolase subunit 2